MSSTASVLRTLASRGEVESVHGERALGVLLVQDVAVVPAVLIVTVLNEGGTAQEVWATILRTAGIGLALVVALYVIFNHVVPRLLSTSPMRANRELPILVATVSGLGSGVVAHSAGVSPALGAFVAGMLLAESPFAIQVRADVSSLKTLLLTLFFTAIGMLSDPVWIASNAVLVATVVAGVVLFKAAIVFGALRLFGAPGTHGSRDRTVPGSDRGVLLRAGRHRSRGAAGRAHLSTRGFEHGPHDDLHALPRRRRSLARRSPHGARPVERRAPRPRRQATAIWRWSWVSDRPGERPVSA